MKNFAYKPREILLFLAISFFLLTGAIVGFDETKDGKAIHDGEKLGKIGECPAPTLAKLKARFNVTEAKAKEKLTNIQKNVSRAIEFISKSDPSVGKCLKDAQESGRLCIDFAAKRSIIGVAKTAEPGCKADRVNINWPYLRACDSITVLDSGFIFLVNVLLHEGVHTEQTTTPTDFKPADSRTDSLLKRIKRKYDMELGAIDSTQKLWCPLIDSLGKSIAGGGAPIPPPLPKGALGEMLGALNGLPTNAQRLTQAKILMQEAKKVKKLNSDYRKFNVKAKKVVCDYLAGTLTLPQLMDSLRRQGILKLQNPYEGDFQSYIMPDPSDFAVNQVIGDTTIQLFHDLDFITDIFLPHPDQMIIAGPTGFGQTALIGFFDTNGDGIFEQSSAQPLMTIPNAPMGLDFIPFPDGRMLVFEFGQQVMLELIDANRDGLPDQVLPQPLSPQLPDFVIDWVASPEDPRIIMGFPVRQDGFQTILPLETYIILQDLNNDNFYEFIEEEERILNIATPPIFMNQPEPGSLSDTVNGTAFSTVELVELNLQGDSIGVFGMIELNMLGFGEMQFGQALPPGIQVQLRDRDKGMNSPIYQLDNSNSIRQNQEIIKLKLYPQPALDVVNLECEWQKRGDIQVKLISLNGQELRNWMFSENQGMQRFQLSLDGISPGAYLLFIEMNGHFVSKKLWVR